MDASSSAIVAAPRLYGASQSINPFSTYPTPIFATRERPLLPKPAPPQVPQVSSPSFSFPEKPRCAVVGCQSFVAVGTTCNSCFLRSHNIVARVKAKIFICVKCESPLPANSSERLCFSCTGTKKRVFSSLTRPIPAPTLVGQPPLAAFSSEATKPRKNIPVPAIPVSKMSPPTVQQRPSVAAPKAFTLPNFSYLRDQPHFNERGEYMFPQFLPPDSPARLQYKGPKFELPFLPLSPPSENSCPKSQPDPVRVQPSSLLEFKAVAPDRIRTLASRSNTPKLISTSTTPQPSDLAVSTVRFCRNYGCQSFLLHSSPDMLCRKCIAKASARNDVPAQVSTGLLSPPPSALPVFDRSEQPPIPGGDDQCDEKNTDTCMDVCKPADPIKPPEEACTLRSPPLTPSPNLSPLSAPSEPLPVCKENQHTSSTPSRLSPPLKFIDFKQKRSEDPQFAVTRGRICSSPSCSTVIFGSLPGAFCRSCKKRFERSSDADTASSMSTVFRIRIPPRSNALPSPSPTPAASSSRPTSPEHTVEADETIRGWDSELSDLTDTSDDDSGDDEMACDTSLEGQDSNMETSMIAERHTSPYTCHINSCCNLLPIDSLWKFCIPCQEKMRAHKSKRRRYGKSSLGQGHAHSILKEGYRLCHGYNCFEVLPPLSVSRFSNCATCRTKRNEIQRRQRHRMRGLSTNEDFEGLTISCKEGAKHDAVRDKASSTVFSLTPVDQYQTFDLLIRDFRMQVAGFLDAHYNYIHHVLSHEPQRTTVDPVLFAFEGEHSVVADPAGGEVATKIHSVRKAVEDVINYKFKLDKGYMSANGVIVGHFSTVYGQYIPHPNVTTNSTSNEASDTPASSTLPATEDTQSQTNVMMRLFTMNMEVGVTWDKSHPYFPGLRTILRFSLVG